MRNSGFTGLKMCYIGDGNNMANSLIVGGLKVGMNVAVATPDGYKPDGEVLSSQRATQINLPWRQTRSWQHPARIS